MPFTQQVHIVGGELTLGSGDLKKHSDTRK